MKRILAAVVLAAAAFACWADSVSVTALGTSLPLSAGPGAKVTLVPTGGTARVEYTFNNSAAISNGTAVWNAWPSGNVSASTNDTAAFQMFVRAVGVTGAAALTVDAADPNTVLYVSSRPWSSQLFGEPVILCKSAVAVSAPTDTSEDTLATCTVPAGAMGANGVLRVWTTWSFTNSGNNKTLRIRFSGASGTQYLGATFTTAALFQAVTTVTNRNATNSQVSGFVNNGTAQFSSNAGAVSTSSVDTTAATSLVFTCQKATGSETCTIESYVVELLPSP